VGARHPARHPCPAIPFYWPVIPAPTRETAITGAVTRFRGDQWSFWPLGTELEERLRLILEARFDELFATGDDGFSPRWITPGHEILITWQPKAERRAQ
jgi:hypothetical protein